MSDFYGWRAAKSHAEEYVDCIKKILSDEKNFNNFRNQNDSGYKRILEHLSKSDGEKYYDLIKKYFPNELEMLTKFSENDNVGNPIKHKYDNLLINPTTLRYSYVALDIKNTFGDLDKYNYVEIGAGYGGQLRALTSLYNFNSRKLFDIPEALKMQESYLSKFNIKCDFLTIDEDFDINDDSIVVSNYAWCELNEEYRNIYMDKIISKCRHAYLTVYDINIEKDFKNIKKNVTFSKDHFNDSTVVKIVNHRG